MEQEVRKRVEEEVKRGLEGMERGKEKGMSQEEISKIIEMGGEEVVKKNMRKVEEQLRKEMIDLESKLKGAFSSSSPPTTNVDKSTVTTNTLEESIHDLKTQIEKIENTQKLLNDRIEVDRCVDEMVAWVTEQTTNQ